jgi:hypothetical protein
MLKLWYLKNRGVVILCFMIGTLVKMILFYSRLLCHLVL